MSSKKKSPFYLLVFQLSVRRCSSASHSPMTVTYLVFLLCFSMFYQATAFTRRWLLAPLWALVARVCGRREADLLEAVLIGGGDGGDN
jgi:hypothetical protein